MNTVQTVPLPRHILSSQQEAYILTQAEPPEN